MPGERHTLCPALTLIRGEVSRYGGGKCPATALPRQWRWLLTIASTAQSGTPHLQGRSSLVSAEHNANFREASNRKLPPQADSAKLDSGTLVSLGRKVRSGTRGTLYESVQHLQDDLDRWLVFAQAFADGMAPVPQAEAA